MFDTTQKVTERKNPLLRMGGDAKTIKSNNSDSVYKTAIMYLAPADTVPGMQLCAMAYIADCAFACLFKAGRGAMSNVEIARIMKTLFFRDNLAGFMALMGKDIARELRKAKKNGYKLAVRLNGTSDIPWELIPYMEFANIFEAFPDVIFYDYTKNVSKARMLAIKGIPNYSVTASYSQANPRYAMKIANQDELNIAVVFRDSIPDFFTLPNGKTLPVISGDKNDERYLDPTDKQYIIGLLAKGPAKKDQTGFVIDQNIIAIAA